MATKYETMFTPLGEIRYLFVNGRHDTFTYNGQTQDSGYTATLVLDDKDARKLKEELINKFKETQEFKDFVEEHDSEPNEINVGIRKKKNKDGKWEWLFKAKTIAEWNNKDGTTTEHVIPLYDGQNNRLDDKTQVWSGSKGRLYIMLKPYKTPAGMIGFSPKLNAVQITELVTNTASTKPAGSPFDTVDGSNAIAYQSVEEPQDESNIPF